MKRLLLSPDAPSGDGGGQATPTAPQPSNPAPAAPPPAATTVLNATRSEREVQLETELKAERESHGKTASEKKARELKIAELEDELHRLKQQPTPPAKHKGGLLDISEFFED